MDRLQGPVVAPAQRWQFCPGHGDGDAQARPCPRGPGARTRRAAARRRRRSRQRPRPKPGMQLRSMLAATERPVSSVPDYTAGISERHASGTKIQSRAVRVFFRPVFNHNAISHLLPPISLAYVSKRRVARWPSGNLPKPRAGLHPGSLKPAPMRESLRLRPPKGCQKR